MKECMKLYKNAYHENAIYIYIYIYICLKGNNVFITVNILNTSLNVKRREIKKIKIFVSKLH